MKYCIEAKEKYPVQNLTSMSEFDNLFSRTQLKVLSSMTASYSSVTFISKASIVLSRLLYITEQRIHTQK